MSSFYRNTSGPGPDNAVQAKKLDQKGITIWVTSRWGRSLIEDIKPVRRDRIYMSHCHGKKTTPGLKKKTLPMHEENC